MCHWTHKTTWHLDLSNGSSSSKQDGSVTSVTWQGWATHLTYWALKTSICGMAKDSSPVRSLHVTSVYGPWKQTFSRSTTDWTWRGQRHAQDEARWMHFVEAAWLQLQTCACWKKSTHPEWFVGTRYPIPEWLSEHTVRAYTTPDSAVLYLSYA